MSEVLSGCAVRAAIQQDPRRPISEAPRDGTLLLLWIAPDDEREHPLDDSEHETPTVGWNNFDNDGEDAWQFAGWCWSHDHFTVGKGTPVLYLPFPAFPAKTTRSGE